MQRVWQMRRTAQVRQLGGGPDALPPQLQSIRQRGRPQPRQTSCAGPGAASDCSSFSGLRFYQRKALSPAATAYTAVASVAGPSPANGQGACRKL